MVIFKRLSLKALSALQDQERDKQKALAFSVWKQNVNVNVWLVRTGKSRRWDSFATETSSAEPHSPQTLWNSVMAHIPFAFSSGTWVSVNICFSANQFVQRHSWTYAEIRTGVWNKQWLHSEVTVGRERSNICQSNWHRHGQGSGGKKCCWSLGVCPA